MRIRFLDCFNSEVASDTEAKAPGGAFGTLAPAGVKLDKTVALTGVKPETTAASAFPTGVATSGLPTESLPRSGTNCSGETLPGRSAAGATLPAGDAPGETKEMAATTPEVHNGEAGLPAEVASKLQAFEDLKNKYDALLQGRLPATAPPSVPDPSTAAMSPAVQNPVFTPEPAQRKSESRSADPPAKALNKDLEETLHEAFDLDRKETCMCTLRQTSPKIIGSWCVRQILLLQELSDHALYMRLKRLCTPTGAGKMNVPKEVFDQWQQGNREELQLALVKALKTHGYKDDGATRKLVRAGVVKRCARVYCLL